MSTPTELAHVVRRTSFGPFPGQLRELDGTDAGDLVDRLLAAPPIKIDDPPSLHDDNAQIEPDQWWLRHIARADVGLHEKMVWYWHGHLTTSSDKVGDWPMLWKQHQLLRQHALGNFRTLLQAITIDPAMLEYLDGADSVASAPNENYAREMMELFALGRGQYTQADVRAAARCLAGWTVDGDKRTAQLDQSNTYPRPVRFLGHHRRMSEADIVDAVCDDPACAPFVATRLHRFFCGTAPDANEARALGDLFRTNDLEIRPLVHAILHSETFTRSRMQRPRPPVEWVTAAIAAMGLPDDGDSDKGADPYRRGEWCNALGQGPFRPPNVAGWPDGPRWLNGGFALARARFALQAPALDAIVHAEDPVSTALARCSVVEVSPITRSALDRLYRDVSDFTIQSRLLLAAVIASPEFALS